MARTKKKSTDAGGRPPEFGAPVRLQKFMAAAGVASRRKAEELIAAGQVEVNGRTVTEQGTKVDPVRDEVRVRGTLVTPERLVYFVLNKPDEMVCTADGTVDPRGRPTVLSLMHGVTQRIYPVGRLDYHSRGVLLMTNDGELAAGLTHPRHAITQTWHAKFQGHVSQATLDQLREGVKLDDGTVTLPADEILVVKQTAANTWVQLTLSQGLHRQVRRMGDAVNHHVLKLIRVAIGDLTADGLEDGHFRALKAHEVDGLRALFLAKRGRKARKGR